MPYVGKPHSSWADGWLVIDIVIKYVRLHQVWNERWPLGNACMHSKLSAVCPFVGVWSRHSANV